MDGAKLAMKWKSADRLVELIVASVASRSRKGDVFRGEGSPRPQRALCGGDWRAVGAGVLAHAQPSAAAARLVELEMGMGSEVSRGLPRVRSAHQGG